MADPAIQAVRRQIEAVPNDSVGRAGAIVRVEQADGKGFEHNVKHGVGSLERPMTPAELDAKFMVQAQLTLPDADAAAALAVCKGMVGLNDASEAANAMSG